MIVDFHTHVFPPEVVEHKQSMLHTEPTFAELYSASEAALATADDLLLSMEEAGIDLSVALGFAWHDTATCRSHNDYLIEAANRSDGRLMPFCTLPLASGYDAVEVEARRCAAAGVKGFGELRPENLAFDLASPDGHKLGRLAAELDAVLLFHVTEPVGHAYPGKQGLALAAFHDFAKAHPDVRIVGAHWAGGLPFFAHMPEVKSLFENLWVDTAATSLLYDEAAYSAGCGAIGPARVLYGSDYPLLSQARSRRRIEESGLDAQSTAQVLGGNAAALLGLRPATMIP